MLELEEVMHFIKRLERKRQKITRRGRLSEEEDAQLDEIDYELEFWNNVLCDLLFEPEEDDTCEDSDPQPTSELTA